jgi:transcription initiation factor TFIIIB Brf1 subunit/transcription initiation factor TFIIB
MEISRWKPQKVLALEYLIDNPTAPQHEVADHAGVTQGTISNWYKDPGFVETFYDRYMVTYNSRLPSVLDAMVKEAQTGNVQAGRLVLEHSGKLQKNIVIKHESPFERFLKSAPIEADYEVIEGDRPQTPTFTEQPLKVFKTGREKKLQKRRESYRLRKRAELVGMKPLGIGRHSRSEFKEWMNELNRKEALNE